MRRGNRWMYWATGLPGWMRQGGGCGWGRRGYWAEPWEMGGEPYGARPWGAPLTAREERESLRRQAEALREQLEEIEHRLARALGE
jgi:hypothetical protein